MRWPIPEIPALTPLPPPKYRLWGMALVVMISLGASAAVFLISTTHYGQIIMFGVVPALLLWLCFFTITYYRHEQSINYALIWQQETENTKSHWQRWSQAQLVVVSNIAWTPERDGVMTLLGDSNDIPAYPQKARDLFGDALTFEQRFITIDAQFNLHCPGYRHYPYRIKLFCSQQHQKDEIRHAVYNQWGMFPEDSGPIAAYFTEHEKKPLTGLIILLCIQDGSLDPCNNYSTFITGQLITSTLYSKQHQLVPLAGIGRILPTDCVTHGLDMLFDYNQVDVGRLHHVWLSGVASDTRIKLIQHAQLRQWKLSAMQPVISLDHTFGPVGPQMHPISIALLVDAAQFTGRPQLLISQQGENIHFLSLISRELYL